MREFGRFRSQKCGKGRDVAMSDDSIKRDEQWSALLTRCYEKIETRQEFKSGLLDAMKTKLAERRNVAESHEDNGLSQYENQWSALLQNTHAPCEANPLYSHNLLMEMKNRQRQIAADKNDSVLGTLLSTSYVPVEPRKEFETRLLSNLKERQKTRILYQKNLRRRSIFSSVVSGMAAAAAVLLVVWLAPVDRMAATPPTVVSAIDSAPQTISYADFSTPPASSQSSVATAVPATDRMEYLPAGFSIENAYSSSALPKTARGIGMEINDGAGWRPLDTATLVRVSPGMAFRSIQQESAGLGFDDGSVIQMKPDAVLAATENGFEVRQGLLSIEVPQESAASFRLSFPERDIAVQPGTLMVVKAFAPDSYAAGGAPAPEVMIVDGGFALAKGKTGTGPLFANQVYMIDNYVTPEIPSRQLCSSELQDWGQCDETIVAPSPSFDPASPALRVSSSSLVEPTPVPRGFYKQDDKWIANTYDNRDTIKVPYLSNAYFSLANERRDLAAALALGSDVIVDGGKGMFYEIHR